MRMINADALIEKLEAWKKEAERRDATINYTFASAIIAQVNAEPTIEERKTGKWEMKPDTYGFFEEIPVCSKCGYTTEMRKTYNFCPHCGADMRGKQDE